MQQGLGATAQGRQPMGRPQIPEANVPPGTPQQGAPQQGAPAGEGMVDATPEEQQMYDRFISMSMMALYDKKMMPKMMKMIESTPDDPVEGIAEVGAQIAMRVVNKAKDDGIDIPGDIILHAGEELIELIVELVEESGIAQVAPEQAEAAFLTAADKFGKMSREAGSYSKEQEQTDTAELERMSGAGEIDSMVQQMSAGRQGEGA